MKTLIQNVRVVSPDLEIEGGSLLLENGRIVSVIASGGALPAADSVIDGGGRMAMPGFFDIHSHGADGHDIGDNTSGSVRHIARRKLQEGVTTWLPTTLTQPPHTLLEIAAHCADYMAAPEFCRVPGLHVEGPFINPKNAGAQNPHFVRLPDFEELARIHEVAKVRILSLAPEMPGALELIRSAAEMGIVSSAAHTSSTAADMIAAKEAGLKHLTHFGNAMTPLHHREIGVVGAGLMDDSLKLELIGDTVHLCPDMLELVFKLVPIERLMMITDSMAASWMNEGEVSLGGLPVMVKDGVARLKEGGALAGSSLRYNHGLKNVVEITALPLHQLVKATSWNQARSLGLDGFGKIEAGFHADIVLLDMDFSVWKTFVGGRER
ncbi:MAG: N-acetylglucosamine-6-phosphate deacetylase [Verrucomicrobiota bacterium]